VIIDSFAYICGSEQSYIVYKSLEEITTHEETGYCVSLGTDWIVHSRAILIKTILPEVIEWWIYLCSMNSDHSQPEQFSHAHSARSDCDLGRFLKHKGEENKGFPVKINSEIEQQCFQTQDRGKMSVPRFRLTETKEIYTTPIIFKGLPPILRTPPSRYLWTIVININNTNLLIGPSSHRARLPRLRIRHTHSTWSQSSLAQFGLERRKSILNICGKAV